MIVTNDDVLAGKLRVLRVHGSKPKYHHAVIGGNFRMDAIQAVVLKVKLKYLDRWTQQRQQNATFYDRAFANAGLISRNKLAIPLAVWKYSGDHYHHCYNQYVIRVAERDQLQSFLKQAGIDTEVYYPTPLHLQKCFQYLGYKSTDFPEAESASREALALPVYPELREAELQYVVAKISEFFKESAGSRSNLVTAAPSRVQ